MIFSYEKNYDSYNSFPFFKLGSSIDTVMTFIVPQNGTDIITFYVRTNGALTGTEEAVFDMLINGVSQFSGNYPTIPTGSNSVNITGLNILVNKGDLIVLRFIYNPKSTRASSITWILDMEDGQLTITDE